MKRQINWSWIWVVVAGLVFMYTYGWRYMWFHQDDLNWMKLAQLGWINQLTTPVNEHINYLFRFMFKIEYELFGWQYPLYLAVSVGLHALTTYMVGKWCARLAGSPAWGYAGAALFVVNTNWNEVVLWVSGQTISITALFTLLALWVVEQYQKKRVGWLWVLLTLWLTSMTSALSSALPIAVLLVYGRDKTLRRLCGLILAWMASVYWLWSAGVGGEIGRNVLVMGQVWVLAMVNTVLGRMWWPWEVGERARIAVTGLGLVVAAGRWGKDVWEWVWENAQARLFWVMLGLYYATVVIGRAQYGVGMMRAERYAYMGLALILPLLIGIVARARIAHRAWVVGVAILVLVQTLGFVDRANRYVERPEQLQALHERISVLPKSLCYQDGYFPKYVFGNTNTPYSGYASLWEGWVIGGAECSKMW